MGASNHRTIALALAALASQARTEPMPPPVEAVHSAQLQPSGIAIRVKSNGCTDKTSFRFETAQGPSGETQLKLVRVRPDRCRALLVNGILLRWEWTELRLPAPVRPTLLNPTILSH